MKIQIFVLATLFALTTPGLHAQSENEKTAIPFITYWSKTDTFYYTITKMKSKYEEGVLSQFDSIQYDVVLSVLDSTTDGYTLQWLPETPFDDNAENGMRQALTIPLGKVVYQTSPTGEYLGIVNWKEVSQNNMKYVKQYAHEKVQGSGDLVKKDQYIKTISNALNSKEGVENGLAKELGYFHFPFGMQMQPDTILYFDNQITNLYGGDPIKTVSAIQVTDVNEQNSECIFHYNTRMDEEDVKRMVVDMLKKVANDPEEFEEMQKTSSISLNDSVALQYNYSLGFPITGELVRQAELITAGHRTSTTEVIRIELRGL